MDKQGKDFFTIYDLGLKRKRWNCVTLSQELESRGFKISPRSLQRYRVRQTCPNFMTAKEIFDALDIDATDDQIKTSLLNANVDSVEKPGSIYFKSSISIKISNLSSDQKEDNASVMLRLKDRIRITQNKVRPSFSGYVTELIRYDLDHHILPSSDNKNSNEGDE